MKQETSGNAIGKRFEVAIERIVPGGEGLARGPGGVVLVEYAAPGDTLEIEIESQRRGIARGRIASIVSPGPGRVAPQCPWYGRCGGCDFQHLSAEAQIDAKEGILRDALQRIGRIEWNRPVERFAAPRPLGSRARVELHANGETGDVGFFARRSNDIVPIDSCPVSRPEINAALHTIRTLPGALPPAIHLLAGNDSVHVEPPLPPLNSGTLWLSLGDLDYLVDPAGFFQSSFELLPALIDHVLASSGSDRDRDTAWDLFSGAGLFTLPLARRFDRVVGVEVDRRASRNAIESATRNRISNARFVTADVAQWVAARRQRSSQPDLVVVDPPRTGLGTQLAAHLADKDLHRLTYVSCDPTTLARDLAILTMRRLQITSIAIFDLFPQTHHVETVVRLVDGPAI